MGTLALTRWVPDATVDAHGQWLFVRDLESGEYWSATAQPASASAVCYDARFRPGVAELIATAPELEIRASIFVAPDDDVEVRLFTITNAAKAAKRLELTSYAELVLNTPAGDMGHPAFSKLFVQTRYDAAVEPNAQLSRTFLKRAGVAIFIGVVVAGALLLIYRLLQWRNRRIHQR